MEANEQDRLETVEQALKQVREQQRQLNMEYGQLYEERWRLQCELMNRGIDDQSNAIKSTQSISQD